MRIRRRDWPAGDKDEDTDEDADEGRGMFPRTAGKLGSNTVNGYEMCVFMPVHILSHGICCFKASGKIFNIIECICLLVLCDFFTVTFTVLLMTFEFSKLMIHLLLD